MIARNLITAVTGVLFVLLNAAAMADELEYEFRVGVGSSDNITRAPDNEIDDTIALIGVALDYERESKGLDFRIDGDIEQREYTEDSFDSETVGAINADIFLKLVPEIVTWVVTDRYGQVQSDPFATNSPENREAINNFATGPDFRFGIGSSNSIVLSGRYGINTFEESDVDSDSIRGRLSYVHALSRVRQVSFNVTTDEIEFDNPLVNDFQRRAAFIGFTSETSRSELSFNIGRNELRNFVTDSDGNFIELEFARDLLTASRVVLSYDEEFTDASQLFSDFQNPDVGFGQTRNVPSVSDPLQIKRASARFETGPRSTRYTFSVSAQEDDYETQTELDRTRLEASFGGRWSLNQRWSLASSIGIVRNDFDTVNRDDEDLNVRASIDLRISDAARVRLEATHLDRESSDARFVYTENRVFLTFRFGR